MKKPIKYFSLVFAAAVCISLSACSASEGGTNSINISSDNSDGLFSIRIEGGKLNISVCGCFNYLDGRGGEWQGGGGSNRDGEER